MNFASIEGSVVLVVDDTPETLSFLTDTIEGAGMTVLIAIDGPAAIDLLDHITPDLILMDAVMPVMDGFETTRRIKGDQRFVRIPIIFMTGLTEPEHVVEGLAAGGVDYIRKPIEVSELLARIRVHLTNARVTQDSHRALDASGRHLLSLDEKGALLWSTPLTASLLARLQPDGAAEPGYPPPIVSEMFRRLRASSSVDEAVIREELGSSRLEMSMVSASRHGEYIVRLVEASEDRDMRQLQESYGLTLRESEILLWISKGKANRQISEILGISHRTVNKHLEQVFAKLGVENRASAASAAVRTLSK